MIQIVKTDKGYVSGTIIGELGKEVTIFRGIPFASPPVGNLRWKPPQPAKPWEGILVMMIDDNGTVHIKWDSGSILGLVPGEDEWEILN